MSPPVCGSSWFHPVLWQWLRLPLRLLRCGQRISIQLGVQPKPLQQGGVPLWFAGDVPQTFARVAKWGVGWSPRLTPPEKIAEGMERIRSHPGCRGQEIGVFYNLANLRLGEARLAQ